jgi:hypothetical protein
LYSLVKGLDERGPDKAKPESFPSEGHVDTNIKGQPARRYELAVKKFLLSPETDMEICREVFWATKSEWDNASKRIGRWVSYGLICAGVFELLCKGFVNNATLAGVEVSHLSFLLYFLPPAVAWCVVNTFTLLGEQDIYGNIMYQIAKQKLRGLSDSKLVNLLTGSYGLLSSDIPPELETRMGGFNSSLYIGFQLLFVIIAPLIFQIIAYMQLFHHIGHTEAGAIVSLMASAVLVVVLFLQIVAAARDPRPLRR